MKKLVILPALLVTTLLSACATYPTGPTVMVLPGKDKTFEQFQTDDVVCRSYAQQQSGGTTASQNATDSTLKSAALATAVGAVAGLLIGNSHQGAAVGAGAGLLVGSAAGSGAGQDSAKMTQRSYDQAYVQCMYAKGEKVPSSVTEQSSAY
jgi:hypothetical protein